MFFLYFIIFWSFSLAFANNELESKCYLDCSRFKSQRIHVIGCSLPLPNLAASKIMWVYQIKYENLFLGLSLYVFVINCEFLLICLISLNTGSISVKAIHYQLVFVNNRLAFVKPCSKYIQFYCGFQEPYEDSWMVQTSIAFTWARRSKALLLNFWIIY